MIGVSILRIFAEKSAVYELFGLKKILAAKIHQLSEIRFN